MAHRPGGEDDRQPASYSPPPLHRPTWMERGWADTADPRVTSGGGASDRGEVPAGRSGAAHASTILVAALLAAFVASLSTFMLLAASGLLDRQVLVSEPVGQQTGTSAQVNPDIVRVVEESAVTQAVELVSPAVVTITPVGHEGAFVFEGVGSGVIYDPDGWIVTNRHVVCNADTLTVQMADGREYQGRIHGVDTLTDLAIVKIEDTDLPAVEVGNSATLRVGQHAIAIGSPLGTFTNSVTTGVVSALGRHIDVQDTCARDRQPESLRNLIQTDAAINPGNSGGALVDASGDLIGINTAIAGEAQGIGFAIPITLARPIMQQAIEGESLSRPWMGIYFKGLTPALQAQSDLLVGYGALIEAPEDFPAAAVFPGSPADEAGLQEGDIITHVDGIKVDGDNPLDEILTQYRPRETVSLRVLRGQDLLDLSLTLGERPPDS